jgi:hypothetical protein
MIAFPAFSSAEEIYTQKYTIASVTKNVEISENIFIDRTQAYEYEFITSSKKQPLIFESTPENPKTNFSYMTPEEIIQLPDQIRVTTTGSDGVVYLETYNDNVLKKALLELEKIFEYRKQRDGTIKKVLRVKTSKTSTAINDLSFYVYLGEEKFLYEQTGYIFLEYYAPYVSIDPSFEGTPYQKIYNMYTNNADRYDRLYWNTNKTEEEVEADKAYILDALLSITQEEFNGVLTMLTDQISDFAFVSKKGAEYTIRITPWKMAGHN